MNNPQTKKSFLQMSQNDWTHWFQEHGEGSFRAGQIWEWVYVKGSNTPQAFSNMSKNLREKLSEEFLWDWPTVDTLLPSSDGSEKLLLKMSDSKLIECVLMPSENRVTLCVSSQVGCRMACTFCQTGKMGLSRHLSAGEILIQLTLANSRLQHIDTRKRRVTNVVFMGMGEPLDNYDNVVEACRSMLNPKLFGLSKHKVTVSTSGLVPEILKLGQDVPVALAISLHTADDDERSRMMPINKTYSLVKLKEALLQFPVHTRHGITFEYVMIAGVNDSLAHAKKLVKFLHGIKAKVNLIPMNAHPGTEMVSSAFGQMRMFQEYLSCRSIPAPVRYSRGQDVSAACGQLATKRENEVHLPPRQVALKRRQEFLEEKRAQEAIKTSN